ncbi:MAG: hypothetical protein JWQ42_2711 [Edaphobacter sp.]|nr:hypothetical protein [Edaphobacter sp.]
MEGLRAELDPLWQARWADCVVLHLADHAYRHIDLTHGTPVSGFTKMDDPHWRVTSLGSDSAVANAFTDMLLQHASELNSIFRARMVSKRSTKELRTVLAYAVPRLIASSQAELILTSVRGPKIWRALADKIARELYEEEAAGDCPEWLLWNKLLISRFFQGCLLDSAQQAAGQMDTFRAGLHGPRSHLIAIAERIGKTGLIDQLPPLVSSTAPSGMTFQSGAFSDLIKAVEGESNRISRRAGIVHRFLDINAPSQIPAHLRERLTRTQLVNQRDHAYRQYEAASLGFGSLCSIEQLLRSLASHKGIAHLRDSGIPKPVGGWLSKLGLDTDLFDLFDQLYSANGPNLRNRAMHSGLFETSSRSLEVIIAASSVGTKPLVFSNSTVPENLCMIFLESFKKLDDYCGTVGLAKPDFSWSRSLWLTPEEADFGHRLHCDLLDPDDGPEWRAQLVRFVKRSLPCCYTQLQTAIYGWLEPFNPDSSVLLFVIWGNIFEAIYRLTLHLIGFSAIQRSDVGQNLRMFQYRMLDSTEGGLCSPAALEALVECLQPQERPIAERTIALAVKVRNALAHGAIVDYDEHNHLAAGHIVIKATQLLMEVSRRHWVREAAYFRSLGSTGSPVENWLSAEEDVYEWP